MRSDKGSVLAFVLVTAIIVMIICAGLARIVLMRSQTTQRLSDGMSGKKKADAAVAALMSAWSQSGTNQVCDPVTAGSVGYICSAPAAPPGAAPCNCHCVPAPACVCPASAAQSRTISCPPTIDVNGGPTTCTFNIKTCE